MKDHDVATMKRTEHGHSADASFADANDTTHGPLGAHEESIASGVRSAFDRARGRAQLNEAISCISPGEKAAYMEATVRAPALVDMESNPDHYLEHADFDPWKAAASIAAYWQARVETFGDDRAFLPMTIAGDGAMSKEDIALLESGFLMVLPNDKQNRPVLFHDRARVPLNSVQDVMRRQRCLFYVLSSLSVTRANRANGFVILSPLVKTTRKTTLENDYNERAVKLITSEVLPIRYVKTHLVILSTRSVFQTFVAAFIRLGTNLGVLQSKFTIHNHSQSPSGSDDALKDLQRHGFDVEGIPAVPFGGIFTIGCFREWLTDRRRLESMTYDPAMNGVAASPLALEEVYINDEETRKRRADASYCRKKRFLKKIEVEVMQEEVERLQQQNERLKEEEAQLQSLLLKARRVVESRLPSPAQPFPNLANPVRSDVTSLQGMLGVRNVHGLTPPVHGASNLLQDPLLGARTGSGLSHSDPLLQLLGTGRSGLSRPTIPSQPLPFVRPIHSAPPSILHDALLESLVGGTSAVPNDVVSALVAATSHSHGATTLSLLDRLTGRGAATAAVAHPPEPLESLRQRLALQLLRDALDRTRSR